MTNKPLKCIKFDREWIFTYRDGSQVKSKHLNNGITNLGAGHWSPYIGGDCYIYSHWDFDKYKLCPICIDDKWGFIDENFQFVIPCQFDMVGVIVHFCHNQKFHDYFWNASILNNVENKDQIFPYTQNEKKVKPLHCPVIKDGKEYQIDMQGNLYEYDCFKSVYSMRIDKLRDFSTKSIVYIAKDLLPNEFKAYPWAYRDSEGRSLEHGTAVLETEMQCNAYLAAYGLMHYKKVERAFDAREFPFQELSGGIEVYDWGCGQGIGTVALIDKFRERGILSLLKKVMLEEPSDVARSRAVLHVSKALGTANVEIVENSLYLPSDDDCPNCVKSINIEQQYAIHIFSNVLDIKKVSLKGVSKLITSSGNKHIVLCVGPASLNEERINSFKQYFKSEGIEMFTDYREVNFGRHPNGKAYGCLIKGFSFNLSRAEDVLHEYRYFAPKQLYCLYGETINGRNLDDAAFEISAPFDLSIHKNLHPVYALISNLISRGCPTLASARVNNAMCSHSQERREKELKTISRIHKTLIEALISGRLSLDSNEWLILFIEDGTDVAQIAIEDFYELFHHLVKMTEDYNTMSLPSSNVYSNVSADNKKEYDIIIDVSAEKLTDSQNIEFSKYKAKNNCYFIVRSSSNLYETRTLYTTERIKYKPFVEKDNRGAYITIEEQAAHLRYFLNLIFRKEDFRPGQLPILSRALQLRSVIGLLPTGGGKSLTYQLAAMLQPAITLVVDPLKGLMKDQYDGLLRAGVDTISYINSDITKDWEEGQRRQNALTASQIQIMFLSPERLSIHKFREVLRSMRESDVYFAYGVIDEVHCVSEWGHDFRLAYLHLGRNLYNYVLPKEVEGEENHISLFGLTATASFDVLADVERELSGRQSYSLEDDATIRYENTNRLELQYNVYKVDADDIEKSREIDALKEDCLLKVIDDATKKITEIQEEDSVELIKDRFVERENLMESDIVDDIYETNLDVEVNPGWYNEKNSDTAGIIFCLRANRELKSYVHNSVPTVETTLRNNGLRSISSYKGGDDTACQDDFLVGKTNVMVATKAFGMGIDKSNVRLTFHLNYPGSLESFVQEAGRAGRDKKMALATIMYSPKKFWVKNVKTNEWQQLSADYTNNKFFYDSNFLGEEFELYVMELLMNNLHVKISNEEFVGVESPTIANSNGIIKYIEKYEKGSVLTYYISYEEDERVLDNYNCYLSERNMPVFSTRNAQNIKNDRGYSYINDYGSAIYKDAIQKAIYRMCIIGLIDDFTEDYSKRTFRITTICQEEYKYLDFLHFYYRKYYSEERADNMMEKVKELAESKGVIMACLQHLTSFIYKSIADKRARGILDMEQFCNMAISTDKDWKETNEDLKDFIYYYFNSKYAREEFVTYDSNLNRDVPFSLKDDTNFDIHSESEITDFDLVRKYMRVVDPEIVNNDSQMDNIKHLQGAIRLIRRAILDINPVLNLLNVFCILYLEQQANEMLEEELYNDYKAVLIKYSEEGKLNLLTEYTDLLVAHGAISDTGREYIAKIQSAIQLEEHTNTLTSITNKYIKS